MSESMPASSFTGSNYLTTVQVQRLKLMRGLLLAWGYQNEKEYPWRYIDDPYLIIVAEFMLHRTQVAQVEPVFNRFISAYPTLKHFINSDTTAAEELLRPLGLHWRTKLMIQALQDLWQSFAEIPADYSKLVTVPGIGQYIAGATVCFSMNKPMPLVDTNTVRVVGRVLGFDLRGEARRKKSVKAAIEAACSPRRPRKFYYALIDFAHMVCTARNPSCVTCPLYKIPCSYGHSEIKRPHSLQEQ